MAMIPDPVLDRVMASPRMHGHGPWKLVYEPFAFPPAWVANRVIAAKSWGELYTTLSTAPHPDQAWFLRRGPAPPAAGTGRSRRPRPELGRPYGDRRARRLVHPDPAANLLPRLVLSDRRRPRAAGPQGRRRPPRCPAPRRRDPPRRAAIPADRPGAGRNRLAHRLRRRRAGPRRGRMESPPERVRARCHLRPAGKAPSEIRVCSGTASGGRQPPVFEGHRSPDRGRTPPARPDPPRTASGGRQPPVFEGRRSPDRGRTPPARPDPPLLEQERFTLGLQTTAVNIIVASAHWGHRRHSRLDPSHPGNPGRQIWGGWGRARRAMPPGNPRRIRPKPPVSRAFPDSEDVHRSGLQTAPTSPKRPRVDGGSPPEFSRGRFGLVSMRCGHSVCNPSVKRSHGSGLGLSQRMGNPEFAGIAARCPRPPP